MSIEEHGATLHVITCDWPRCRNEREHWAAADVPRWSMDGADWTSVCLSENDESEALALCPEHGTHKQLLLLVLDLIERKAETRREQAAR